MMSLMACSEFTLDFQLECEQSKSEPRFPPHHDFSPHPSTAHFLHRGEKLKVKH